jgi:hypothetical protein
MLTKLKPSVKELLIIYGTGLIIIILSAVFFTFRGYPLVTTATETLNIYTPPLYMISIFLPYGILIGEIIWLWNEQKENLNYILLLIECIIVGIFSFIRFIVSIPFSGHAIILFFYLLHQAFNNKFNHPLRLLIGIAVLIITVIYKIYLWNDPITFLLGALLGIALWIPGFLFRLKIGRKE